MLSFLFAYWSPRLSSRNWVACLFICTLAVTTHSTTIIYEPSRQQYFDKFIHGVQKYTHHPFDTKLRNHPHHDTNFTQRAASLQRKVDDVEPVADADADLGGRYQAIRIQVVFDESSLSHSSLTTEEKNFLRNELMPAAIEKYESMLQVIPVQGNLFAKRQCSSYYDTTPRVCAEVELNPTCFGATVPLDHLEPLRVCSTCVGTGCSDESESASLCTMLHANATGVPHADVVLYVQVNQDDPSCKGGRGHVLASAAACQLDQYDRPTFGAINFCPQFVSTDAKRFGGQLNTAMHEIGHVLGFSEDMYAYMREADGTPRTPRDANGAPIQGTHDCGNSVIVHNYAMPSTSTIQTFHERGRFVKKLVTPHVKAFVRQHFGCASLQGAELENQEDGSSVCIGSHWEERLFESEYMSAVQGGHNVVSGLTLAFFDDSGWYRTQANQAEAMHWGYHRGCRFAMETCVDVQTGESVDRDHFCTDEESQLGGCTVDAYSMATCGLKNDVGKSIPMAFQYFRSNGRKGGATYADFCPLLTGYTTGSCLDASNLFHPPGTHLNVLGETYGHASRCMLSTLRAKNALEWALHGRSSGCYEVRCTGYSVHISVPRPSVISTSTEVDSDSESTALPTLQTVTCDQKGEEIQVDGYQGSLFCPDPRTVCRSSAQEQMCASACGLHAFCVQGTCHCLSGYVLANATGGGDTSTNGGCVPACPKACSHRGRCDASSGRCSCNSGWGGGDCSKAIGEIKSAAAIFTSPASSSSYSVEAFHLFIATSVALLLYSMIDIV